MYPGLEQHIDKYYGKYLATVVDNEDPEKRGQIKIYVPSLFEENTSVLAKPCLPPGHFFIPPVESKVWVEFEGGNINHPIWVGVWYPQESPPIEVQQSPPTVSQVYTPGGFRFEFSDKEGEEKCILTRRGQEEQHIVLHFSAGEEKMEIVNSEEQKITLEAEKISIEDKNKNLIELKSSGVIILDGEKNKIELESSTGIKVEDKNENIVELNSSGITIEDSKGNKVELESSGVTIEDKNQNTIELKDANITIKAVGQVLLNEGTAGIVTGFPTGTHPVCFITGAPIVGSVTCKASP